MTAQKPSAFLGGGGVSGALSLGAQLRELRKAKGLSLQTVAKRAGLSVSMVSQIERNLSSPSLRSMRELASAVEVPIEMLFRRLQEPERSEQHAIVRPENRRALVLEKYGMYLEMICPEGGGALQTFIANILPTGGSGPEMDRHQGEEAGLVLCGQLDMWLGEDHFHLREGDSFRYDAQTPHRYQNTGPTITRVHWTITPPFYADQPRRQS